MVAAMLLALAAGGARADEATLRAKQHNAEAKALFSLGKFREAADAYEKAYRAKPVPEFLHNLAQCYRRIGGLENLEKAVFYFESYLNNASLAVSRGEVESEIAELRSKIAELRRARTSTTPEPQPRPVPSWKRTAGWICIGVGAASLVTGLIMGYLAMGKSSEYKTAVRDGQTFEELGAIEDQGESQSTIAVVTLVLGGVIAGAGGGLLIWDSLGRREQRRSAARTEILPVVGPGTAGAAARIRF